MEISRRLLIPGYRPYIFEYVSALADRSSVMFLDALAGADTSRFEELVDFFENQGYFDEPFTGKYSLFPEEGQFACRFSQAFDGAYMQNEGYSWEQVAILAGEFRDVMMRNGLTTTCEVEAAYPHPFTE